MAPTLLPGGYQLLLCTIRNEMRGIGLYASLASSVGLAAFLIGIVREVDHRSLELGRTLLTCLAFALALSTLFFLSYKIPCSLALIYSPEMANLVQLSGLRAVDLWRARVWGAACHVMLIPLTLLPFAFFISTCGGVRRADFFVLGFWWLQWTTLAVGITSLIGVADRRPETISSIILVACCMGVPLYAWFCWAVPLLCVIVWQFLVVHDATTSVLTLWPAGLTWLVSPLGPVDWEWGVAGVIHTLLGLLLCRLSRTVLAVEYSRNFFGGAERTRGGVKVPVPPRPRCPIDPWFWKEFHVMGGGYRNWKWRWILSGLGAAAVVVFRIHRPKEYMAPMLSLIAFVTVTCFASEIGKPFAREFADRTWSQARLTAGRIKKLSRNSTDQNVFQSSVPQILRSTLHAALWRFLPGLLPMATALTIVLSDGCHSDVCRGNLAATSFVTLVFGTNLAGLMLHHSTLPKDGSVGAGSLMGLFGFPLVLCAILLVSVPPRIAIPLNAVIVIAVSLGYWMVTKQELEQPHRQE